MKKLQSEEKDPKCCSQCKYYDLYLNMCKDKEYFIDKNNPRKILCRYSENAIKFYNYYRRI